MSITKQVLILANSVKHWPCSCVAGKEIDSTASKYKIGNWIRPVSTHGEGELSQSETLLSNGKQPKVFDFVEMHLDSPTNEPLQPENWVINTSHRWQRVNSKFERPLIDLLVDTPTDLWREPNESTSRVSPTFLEASLPTPSLFLVRVQGLRARFEWSEWNGQFKQRRYASFSYNGHDYSRLAITDPIFGEVHRTKFPSKGNPPCEFGITNSGDCHVCVSLAPEFKGYHYKVVATVFETQ